MRHARTRAVAGMLAVVAATAGAQQLPADTPAAEPEVRRYAVEIILFRYGDGVPSGNELFLADPPPDPGPFLPPGEDPYARDSEAPVAEYGDPLPAPPDGAGNPTPNLQSAGPTGADPAGVELEQIILPAAAVGLAVTPRAALTLEDVWNKLDELDAYEPVLWAGWTQAAVERELSPSIALRRLGNAPAGYDGTLQLYLGRFLHLVVDLTLTPRDLRTADTPRVYRDARRVEDSAYGAFDAREPGPVRLRIEEDRIVRNGELRYFDHPRFGLLARVTRVEDAVEETVDDAAGGGVSPGAR